MVVVVVLGLVVMDVEVKMKMMMMMVMERRLMRPAVRITTIIIIKMIAIITRSESLLICTLINSNIRNYIFFLLFSFCAQ